MCDTIVEITACATASEFIDALSRRRPEFASDAPGGWIFRGHADDEEYKLIPKALRNDSAQLANLAGMRIAKTTDQITAEYSVLYDFFRTADGNGLPIPEDTQQLRHDFEQWYEHPMQWPPTSLLSLMALAQHHGVPTRLLDWSRHPLKAALFAAHEASESDNKKGLLSVWAFSKEYGVMADFKGLKRPFTVVTAPGATNANLRAQEGVFILAPPIEYKDTPVDRSPFDKMLAIWLKDNQVRAAGPWFRRVTLPKDEAENLCFALAFEGITRSALFPDFYGVVKAMEDWARWRRSSGPVWKHLGRVGAPFVTKGIPLVAPSETPEQENASPQNAKI